MTTKTKPQEPVLTEFFVTEKYIVKARTSQEVQDLINSDSIDWTMGQNIEHLGIDIEPNF
jgi:hypothetical protein